MYDPFDSFNPMLQILRPTPAWTRQRCGFTPGPRRSGLEPGPVTRGTPRGQVQYFSGLDSVHSAIAVEMTDHIKYAGMFLKTSYFDRI